MSKKNGAKGKNKASGKFLCSYCGVNKVASGWLCNHCQMKNACSSPAYDLRVVWPSTPSVFSVPSVPSVLSVPSVSLNLMLLAEQAKEEKRREEEKKIRQLVEKNLELAFECAKLVGVSPTEYVRVYMKNTLEII
jgi:hypothetical protein